MCTADKPRLIFVRIGQNSWPKLDSSYVEQERKSKNERKMERRALKAPMTAEATTSEKTKDPALEIQKASDTGATEIIIGPQNGLGTTITESAPLVGLGNLTNLNLSGVCIDNNGILFLRQCTNLRKLDLMGNFKLSDIGKFTPSNFSNLSIGIKSVLPTLSQNLSKLSLRACSRISDSAICEGTSLLLTLNHPSVSYKTLH